MKFKEFLNEEEKSSKKVAKYQNQPNDEEKCSGCSMWRPPNACSSVKGVISENGWCKWWESKK